MGVVSEPFSSAVCSQTPAVLVNTSPGGILGVAGSTHDDGRAEIATRSRRIVRQRCWNLQLGELCSDRRRGSRTRADRRSKANQEWQRSCCYHEQAAYE